MANLTRWNPFAELEEMLDRYSRASGVPRLSGREGDQEVMRKGDWAPAVDITEDNEAYLIKAELPGVERDDVKVQVHDGVLTLQGERRSEKRGKGQEDAPHRAVLRQLRPQFLAARQHRRGQHSRRVQGRRIDPASAQERKSQAPGDRREGEVTGLI